MYIYIYTWCRTIIIMLALFHAKSFATYWPHTINWTRTGHGNGIQQTKIDMDRYGKSTTAGSFPRNPLKVNIQKSIEHGHLSWVFRLNMVIFHSKLLTFTEGKRSGVVQQRLTSLPNRYLSPSRICQRFGGNDSVAMCPKVRGLSITG